MSVSDECEQVHSGRNVSADINRQEGQVKKLGSILDKNIFVENKRQSKRQTIDYSRNYFRVN